MRSVWRTLAPALDRALVRDIAAMAAALGVVGASFGAVAVAYGNPVWVPILMSLLVFAGGAQFMAVGVVAAGGSLAAAVVAGLMLNLRMLPFGMAVGPVFDHGWRTRLLGSHFVIDESVAFAMANQHDPDRARQAFWLSGGMLYVIWNIGVALGAVASTVIQNTDAFGIDAAFPAALLALVLPALRDRDTRNAAVIGVVVALLATPWLPPGLPVLLALSGVLVTCIRPNRSARTGAEA